MQPHQGKSVRDLKAWELPRLDDLEGAMVEELAIEARAIYGDRVRFGDDLYRKLRDRLRELVETAVNEVIEYWLKGLADGNDGRFPELNVEFPYLERDENTNARCELSQLGAAMTSSNVRKLMTRSGKAAGLQFPVHRHMLRRTTGYNLANDGHDTRSIQQYMGHKNIMHTVRYKELAPDRFKDFFHD